MFDGLVRVFRGVLKGAGGHRVCHAPPIRSRLYASAPVDRQGIRPRPVCGVWSCAWAYVISLSISSEYRFRQGRVAGDACVEVKEGAVSSLSEAYTILTLF